jgi:hypothetical protein
MIRNIASQPTGRNKLKVFTNKQQRRICGVNRRTVKFMHPGILRVTNQFFIK